VVKKNSQAQDISHAFPHHRLPTVRLEEERLEAKVPGYPALWSIRILYTEEGGGEEEGGRREFDGEEGEGGIEVEVCLACSGDKRSELVGGTRKGMKMRWRGGGELARVWGEATVRRMKAKSLVCVCPTLVF
jgi:hypothetical protein